MDGCAHNSNICRRHIWILLGREIVTKGSVARRNEDPRYGGAILFSGALSFYGLHAPGQLLNRQDPFSRLPFDIQDESMNWPPAVATRTPHPRTYPLPLGWSIFPSMRITPSSV